MQRFVLAASAALLLNACGSETSGKFETADGDEINYSVETDGSNTTSVTSVTGRDGTMTMRSGTDAALSLPAGFTLYPGATLLSNTAINTNDNKGAFVIMESGDAPEKLLSFYRKQALSAGVKFEMELITEDGLTISGRSKGGTIFSFTANAEGGETNAQLTLSQSIE